MIDMYLSIDGVKGESTDDKHKDWIEVLSYSHHMSMPVSNTKSSAGGGSTVRTQHGDLSITKFIDLSSPKLAEAVSKGTHYKTAKLELCRAGGSQVPYLTISLGQVLISSVQHNGSAPSNSLGSEANKDLLPTEDVTLNYGTIEWNYTQQKRTDGSGGGSVNAKFDLTAGK
jgi:type VI secretion system secreted protein Hcp